LLQSILHQIVGFNQKVVFLGKVFEFLAEKINFIISFRNGSFEFLVILMHIGLHVALNGYLQIFFLISELINH